MKIILYFEMIIRRYVEFQSSSFTIFSLNQLSKLIIYLYDKNLVGGRGAALICDKCLHLDLNYLGLHPFYMVSKKLISSCNKTF